MQRLKQLSPSWRAALAAFAGALILAMVAAPVMAAWAYPTGPSNSLWLLGERFGANDKRLAVPIGDFPRVDRAEDVVKATPDVQPVPVNRNAGSDRPVANKGWSAPSGRIRYTAGDVDMLAHLIQAEAGGEPYAGQVAVAAVVINRIQSGKFPNSVYGVIFEQDAFEPILNGTFWNPPTDTAYKAAYDALNGWDPSGGALFFFAPAKTDSAYMWSRPQTTWIGDHLFAR